MEFDSEKGKLICPACHTEKNVEPEKLDEVKEQAEAVSAYNKALVDQHRTLLIPKVIVIGILGLIVIVAMLKAGLM